MRWRNLWSDPIDFLGGMDLDYAYDAAGRFAAITSVVATVTNVATYAYVPNSRLLTGYTMGGFTRTVDYEPDRNLIASVVNTFGANLISRFDYTNDALGRRTQRLDTPGGAGILPATNSFTYNVRSELASALFPSPLGTPISRSATYQYDPIGNRIQAVENTVQTDYVSNMLNQYTAINAASPSYDDDGNMLTTGSGWTLGWDGENRLVTASNANTVITNTYDPRSRRIRKQVAGYNSTSDLWLPTSDLRYFYDGWSLLHEHDVITGNPVTHYLWGLDLSGTLQGAGGVGGLLAEIRSGQVAASAADANGNITEYVNGQTGGILSPYAYDGFGKTIAAPGIQDGSAYLHRFSSKYLDAEIGWYYYGYRFYAPEIGRWPSRDPIGERGGVNVYRMANNDTVCLFDIAGLFVEPGRVGVRAGEIIDDIYNISVAFAQENGLTGDCCGINMLRPELLMKRIAESYQGNQAEPRYIWTKNGGWVDLSHLFTAAYESIYYPNFAVSIGGYITEEDQANRGDRSAWGVEDLPSNRHGLDFWDSMPPIGVIENCGIGLRAALFLQNVLGGIESSPYPVEVFNEILNLSENPILDPGGADILIDWLTGRKYRSSGSPTYDRKWLDITAFNGRHPIPPGFEPVNPSSH